VAVVAATPVAAPVSKSEFFDSRVPIPVPKVTPLPAVIAAHSPSPAPAPFVRTPATMQTETMQTDREKITLTNPVRLSAAPVPVTPEVETKEPPKPAMTIQPRRHYVVNAGTSTELEALLPVRPVAAMVER